MTESPSDGKTPLVQPAVKADTPRDTAADPKADPYAQARALRAQAAALEAAAPSAEFVRLKVEAPHESFAYGGVVVGSDWTAVHATLAPGVLSAAGSTAGVTITQEGQ